MLSCNMVSVIPNMGRSAKRMGVSMFKAVYDMQVRWNDEPARFVALTIEEARENMPSALGYTNANRRFACYECVAIGTGRARGRVSHPKWVRSKIVAAFPRT